MKLLALLSMWVVVAAQPPAVDFWKYPENGPSSQGEHRVGKAGVVRSYRSVTNERPETVILWYAKRLKLGDDDSLVKLAKAGFHNLKTPHDGSFTIVRDTDAEQWGAVILSSLSAEHAAVHIFVRPENDSANDVAISISQSPSGTVISVFQSLNPE